MTVPVMFNSQDISALPQKVNDSSGILANCVVVAGTAEDQVKRPAAANAKGLYVAGHDAANGEDLSCYDFGHAWLIASGAVVVNDDVNIGNTTGHVKTVSEAPGTLINRVGVARSAASGAGKYVKVRLTFDRYTA